MSGWNAKRGVFGLTWTKAVFWLRRTDFDLAPYRQRGASMELFAELFRREGIEVVRVADAFIEVKAKPGRVWEILSGQPSSPEHEAHYLR